MPKKKGGIINWHHTWGWLRIFKMCHLCIPPNYYPTVSHSAAFLVWEVSSRTVCCSELHPEWITVWQVLFMSCLCVQVSASFTAVEKEPLYSICILPPIMQDHSAERVCFCFASHFFTGKFQGGPAGWSEGRAKRGRKRPFATPLPYKAPGTGSSSCWMRRRRWWTSS